MPNKQTLVWKRNLTWAAILITLLILIYWFSDILTPFFIAALLAYLSDPLASRMVKCRCPRSLAAASVLLLTFILILLLLFLIVPILEHQLVSLIMQIPVFVAWLQTAVIPWLNVHFGVHDYLNLPSLQTAIMKNWQQAGDIAGILLKTLTHSGYSLFVFVLDLVLIPVVTFYLLRDWPTIRQGVRHLIPRDMEKTVVKLAHDCNDVIGAFFRGQLLVMLSLAIFYSLSLSLLQLHYALLLGLIIGLMTIVPYLGFTLGILIAMFAAFLQFQDWTHVSYVIFVFVIGHILENYILAPILVGDRIGLHPVAVIFSILAGGQLFGFIGVLLALPIAAVVMVLLRHLRTRYFVSELYVS